MRGTDSSCIVVLCRIGKLYLLPFVDYIDIVESKGIGGRRYKLVAKREANDRVGRHNGVKTLCSIL